MSGWYCMSCMHIFFWLRDQTIFRCICSSRDRFGFYSEIQIFLGDSVAAILSPMTWNERHCPYIYDAISLSNGGGGEAGKDAGEQQYITVILNTPLYWKTICILGIKG